MASVDIVGVIVKQVVPEDSSFSWGKSERRPEPVCEISTSKKMNASLKEPFLKVV